MRYPEGWLGFNSVRQASLIPSAVQLHPLTRIIVLNAFTLETLSAENQRFIGTTGISCHNRALGFLAAFRDNITDKIYLSRFADGHPAPIHCLDGLPDEAILVRSATGRVVAVKASLETGFVLEERFYTREQAAQLQAL